LKGKALSRPNRGVAIKEGRVVRGTPDGFLIALDMAEGKLLWERQITSAEDSHYLSIPAMIIDDVIIYGTAGADRGGRGWIGAFRLVNGEEALAL
jgi:alcohol dehydrogenase (cytochrome c)